MPNTLVTIAKHLPLAALILSVTTGMSPAPSERDSAPKSSDYVASSTPEKKGTEALPSIPADAPADEGIESFKAGNPADLKPSRELLLMAKSDPDLKEKCSALIGRAREGLEKPLMVRAYSLDELRAVTRLHWDERYDTADESFRETFALGRSDWMMAPQTYNDCVMFASAYVLSGEQVFLDRVLAQLEECSTWEPLQRSGWNSYARKAPPSAEGDGVWLTTGRMLSTFTDTLNMLAEEDVPPELRARIKTLMQNEVERIVDDFQSNRPWYVRAHAIHSNQWALPLAGLVNATVYLGRDKYPEEYEYGVEGLIQTLDAQGEKGEFIEGVVYSVATIGEILSAAYNSALDGDRRLIDHPFLKNYPVWLANQIQPGEYIVNPFDNGFGTRYSLRRFINMFSRMAVMIGSPQAIWVRNHFPECPDSGLFGMLSLALPASEGIAPPLYNEFPKNATVVWRDSWDKEASGFWMRGGSPTDFHDHMDRGHVSFTVEGRAILIEAGAGRYGNPNYLRDYRSIIGHNVLQVGEVDMESGTKEQLFAAGQPREEAHRVAPLDIAWLDEEGGCITADMSTAYPAAKEWVRTVEWDTHNLEAVDEVVLENPDTVIFRWHLGAPAKDVRSRYGPTLPKADLTLEDGVLKGEGYTLSFEADQPVTAEIVAAPDYTLWFSSEHYCLVIRSKEPVASLNLTTRIEVEPGAAGHH
ncbi:MAG: heparinase II/III domain-containing protein [Puniceicoccales bacterium]